METHSDQHGLNAGADASPERSRVDFTPVPAPDGFELRITDASCGDPSCTSCTTPLWLHWLSPRGEDRWLMIAATREQPQFGAFTEPGAADRYLRFCIALGMRWVLLTETTNGARQVGLRQLGLMQEIPSKVVERLMTTPLDELRTYAAEGDALVDLVAAGEIGVRDAIRLVETDDEVPS